MRCHQCNQESISRTTDEQGDIHIVCNICGFDLNCKDGSSNLCALLLYNEELEQAEKLGRTAYIDNNSINPYSIKKELALNKRWEEGWKLEETIYEREAFLSSAENLKNEIKKIVEKQTNLVLDKKRYSDYSSKLVDTFEQVKNKKYLLGRTYRQELEKIFKEIESLSVSLINS